MAASNSKIREQIAKSNRNEVIPILNGRRYHNANKQKIDQDIISTVAENIQYNREIEHIIALIEQEYIDHQRRIDDLKDRLSTTRANKGFLHTKASRNKTALLIVRNRLNESNEDLAALHAKQTRQNKLKMAAYTNLFNFEKEVRKKAKARSMGSVSKSKTSSMKRNSY